MLRCAPGLVLYAVLLAPDAPAQERVGSLGVSTRIDIEGAVEFAAPAVVDGVFASADALQIAHPSAVLAPYLEWIRARIEAGYRYAGYRDVRVEVGPNEDGSRLSIRVDEGERMDAAGVRVEMEHADPVVITAIERALSDQGDAALWRAGGPARFGDGALEEIRAAVLRACDEVGALSAEVALRRVERGDGAIDLEVSLRRARPRAIESIRFDGIDTIEAERVRIRIGFRPGMVASADGLAALERAVNDIGRYRAVVIDPPSDGDGPINPLVIRLTPAVSIPAWDEMPWEEMELIRRAARRLGARVAAGAHVHFALELDEPTGGSLSVGPGRVEWWMSASAMRVDLPELRILGVTLGDSRLILDGEHGLRIEAAALGEVLHVPLPDAGGRGGVMFQFQLVSTSDPEQPNSSKFGFVILQDLAARIEQLPPETVISFGPNLAVTLELHGATVLSLLEELRAPDLEQSGELVIGSADDPDALRIDRQTAEARISVTHGSGLLEVRDDSVPVPERGGSGSPHGVLQPDPAGDGGPSRLLGLLLEMVSGIELPAWQLSGSDPRPFLVPGTRPIVGFGGVWIWARDVGDRFAASYPSGSWPDVFGRNLPWMAIHARRTWPGFAAELERLLQADACGPLGCGILVQLMDLLGAEEPGRWFSELGKRACTFEALWRDVEALGAPGSWTGGLLRRVGAAWRAGAASMPPDIAAALEAVDDDLAAVRVGLRVFWDAGLGDALRGEFRRRS